MKMSCFLAVIISVFGFSCSKSSETNAPVNSYDVVVYGGTSAAVTSAIQAKRMGKTVVVIGPDVHLGKPSNLVGNKAFA
jgi:hypothetical protein